MATRGLALRGAIVAAAVAALVAIASARPVMPPFLPIGDHAAYDARTPAAVTLVEPVAHAPWFGAASAPAAAALAAAIGAALFVAAHCAGGALAAAVAFAALVAAAEWRVPLALGGEPVIAVGLLWTSGWLLTGAGGGRATAWAVALAAAAAGCWPPIVVTVPVLAVLAGARRPIASVAIGGAALAGTTAGFALWAARATALGGEPVSVAEVGAVVLAADGRGFDAIAWPPGLAAWLAGLLMLAGAVALAGRVARRMRMLLGAAALAPLLAALLLPAWRDEIARATLWAAWPLVAAGTASIAARLAPRRPSLATAGIGVALVSAVLAASVADGASADRRRTAATVTAALAPLVAAEPATVVAENRRLDAALTAWGATADLRRVRAVPRLVDAARSDGRTVLAGPSARTALELWGFEFAPRIRVGGPARFAMATLTGRLHCVPVAQPWRELPGLEFTGRLGLHAPAGAGQLEVVIVGPPPLAPRLTFADGRSAGHAAPVSMDLPSLPPVLWPGDGRLPDPALSGLRLTLPAQPDRAQSAVLALGQRAPLVAVRYTEPAHLTGVATACAAPLPRDAVEIAGAVPLDDEVYFAGGWGGAVRAGGVTARVANARAIVLVPASSAGARTVALRARPRAATTGWGVGLLVNGWAANPQPMVAGDHEYRWPVPDGVWVAGTNELVFDVAWTGQGAASDASAEGPGLIATSLRILDP
jgi:hypothetical protein